MLLGVPFTFSRSILWRMVRVGLLLREGKAGAGGVSGECRMWEAGKDVWEKDESEEGMRVDERGGGW